MSKIFLYKENSDDRDCCAYIEDNPLRFECGHYFGSVILHGACYCGHDFAPYSNIKTVLTEQEYNNLINFNKSINDLGCGITKGDERYQKGIELCKEIQPIYDKLKSPQAQEFFEKTVEEEKEYLMNEYGFDEDDIEQIFDEYYLDYRDRGIVFCVFKDVYDLGYEEAINLGYVKWNDPNDIASRYFDFEQFGEDLLNDEGYMRLTDDRCVVLNY